MEEIEYDLRWIVAGKSYAQTFTDLKYAIDELKQLPKELFPVLVIYGTTLKIA